MYLLVPVLLVSPIRFFSSILWNFHDSRTCFHSQSRKKPFDPLKILSHSIFLSIEILHSMSRPPNFRSIEVLIHLIFGIFRVSSFEVNREGRELLLNYLNRDRFSQKGVPSRAERRDSSLCFSFFFFPLSLSLPFFFSRKSTQQSAVHKADHNGALSTGIITNRGGGGVSISWSDPYPPILVTIETTFESLDATF